MTNTAATTVISMPNGKGIKSDRQQPNMNDSDDSTSLPSSSEEEPTFRQHSNGTTSSTSEEKPTFREHFKPSSSVVMVRPFPEPPTVSPSSVQVVSAKVEPASAQLVLDSGSDSGKHTRENEKRDSLQQQPTVESSSSAKNWRSRLSTRHVYSRPTQVEQIVSAYERKLAQPEIPAFIVVMGPLGSGKTRLVHDALHDRVVAGVKNQNNNGG
jgi:hypothetical protein